MKLLWMHSKPPALQAREGDRAGRPFQLLAGVPLREQRKALHPAATSHPHGWLSCSGQAELGAGCCRGEQALLPEHCWAALLPVPTGVPTTLPLFPFWHWEMRSSCLVISLPGEAPAALTTSSRSASAPALLIALTHLSQPCRIHN